MSLHIGPHTLANPLALAPMAGVTDRPFRQLCRELGAGYVVTEMVASDPRLRGTRKSRWRSAFVGEAPPVAVQIAGAEPEWLAEAARYNVGLGAEIVDINMGCPAKKVCRKAAGSALLADEGLVREILEAVVEAVDVPVTVKIRTGPTPDDRNGVRIARIAEAAGVAMLAVHGRTRADRFRGRAEYETIRAIREAVSLPLFANGDITTPQEAAEVLAATRADGLMIGRAAQGNPWIFREIDHYLATGEALAPPSLAEVAEVATRHLRRLHGFYGRTMGVRIARKHIGWYLKAHRVGDERGVEAMYRALMRVEDAEQQIALLAEHLAGPAARAA